ncbi:polyprenyl synthetase family protein [Streptomyces sp. TRM68416]|uniref:polyprenyl synthetase family protein n=1 Tax=Streptomyces sp. TRM68416 TaxID=2758412 RepID=UPI00166218CF|nr:polyprenyl synthetase family protein [Streptomyces sp. TRM68416]MBD0839744.1 polyprenyl synthetase family protein [Streptomyces sp. TRM68416]
MRHPQAKELPAALPPPVPRLVPVPGSCVPARTDPPAPQAGHDGPGTHGTPPAGTLPADLADARAIDTDVPAAVGRMLDHLLADRLDRAHLVDPLFAKDLAERVTRFTREGGKRSRPQLLWWSARACGGPEPAGASAALRIGAALELLQTCALVHDDVMDRSPLRRGRPALHADLSARYADRVPAGPAGRFGESAAILAGDLALAWADDVVAETPLPAWTTIAVRRLWSDMRLEMVAGQYLDLHGQTVAARSLPRTLRAACLKSALYSVERPLALGAALAGADSVTVQKICTVGRRIGMAFQLRDDVTDVFGDARHTGKPCGGDIREGKATYLVVLARARAEADDDRAALKVLDRCVGNAALTAADLDEVREVLVRTGARAAVETKIERLVEQGLRHFDSALLDPDGGRRLRRLLVSAVDVTAPPEPAGRVAQAAPGRGEDRR